MRWGWSVLAIGVLAAGALAADQPNNLAVLPCPQAASDSACNPSKVDLKKSKDAFAKALKLQKAEHFDEAYQEFDTPLTRQRFHNRNHFVAILSADLD